MKRKALTVLVAAAVAGAVLLPIHLLADIASCSVNASSFADAVLNPSRGEDTEFFVSTGGVPNIMFVLDTSGSMRRLAPDGASQSWGSFGATYGCANVRGNSRGWASPCGATTVEGASYNADTTGATEPPDWAISPRDPNGQYCPYMVSGNQAPATDKPGFDPDFYGSSGSNPWFFEYGKVYHDAIVTPDPTSDGWTDWTTSPAAAGSTAYTTWADFCGQWSADPAKASSCNTCMKAHGYFFDGTYRPLLPGPPPSTEDAVGGYRCTSTTTTDPKDGLSCVNKNAGTCIVDSNLQEYDPVGNSGTAHCRLPNVWFTGNFLNFYPPKFIVARKVLKDVLQAVRKIRLGLTVFNAEKVNGELVTGRGGNLLRGLNPGCNMLGSPSSYDSNRTAVKNLINNPFYTFGNEKYSFVGSTPLAETLLNVGQLYSSVLNAPWFNDTYSRSDFTDAPVTSVGKSVCFSCQASAVLLITDGIPTYDGSIPGKDFAAEPMTTAVANRAGSHAGMAGYNITDISSADCPTCNTPWEQPDPSIRPTECTDQPATGACDENQNPIPSYLPKVAWYLKNLDLRPDAEKGTDNLALTKKQAITTYTIGLGTRKGASQILQDTADAGGGLYNGGTGAEVTDAKTLKDAILRVLDDVNTRSTSFGAASLSTLQIASSQGVLIPRFEPSRNAHWDGHLFSFDLYSEFASGCRPAAPGASGPANGDYDCDGKCSSVFLKDADGDFIQEDSNGAFRKNLDRTRAPCGNGSLCAASNCSQADPNALAKPFWDAGSKLAPVKTSVDPVSGLPVETPNPDFPLDGRLEWTQRKVYTAIDRNGDGKIERLGDEVNGNGAVIDLTEANADLLAPYLNIKGTRYCPRLVARLADRGDVGRATRIDTEFKAGTYTTCAQVIIDYVLGADVFNERGCGTYPTTYCTRRYQLGDIFHSSPIEVWPPLPSDSFSCPRGLHPQCLPSLFSASVSNPSTATPANASAYDDYAKSDRYRNRQKFVLVGANDGMLHAFRIERSDPRAGEEIWGFVPPDLLPKLRMLLENVHQFYVDATPMVRDVWIDGVPGNDDTTLLPGAAANGVRQGREFHTVAVVGERRGGTHYFALDVTEVLAKGNASNGSQDRPKFLWLYPQPNDAESLAFGETYVEFVPKPPPIGPVKLDAGPAPCGPDTALDPDGSNRCFRERWIAFLSGGFDAQYTKGRGVHMVAIDTGDEIWDFSQPPRPADTCDGTQDPRCHLNYPVAATVGMMMWGTQPAFLSSAAVNGYFDTATFGDTGGQLWVLRFNVPGTFEPSTGKVNNWFGARAFQHGLNASTPPCGLGYCDGQPFFYISSNVPLAANGLYRTLAGTGDRFNVLDPIGGTCGPDNIRACLLKGCTVKLDDGAGGPGAVYGVEPLLGKQTYSADHPALCSGVNPATYRYDVTGTTGPACTTVTSRVNGIQISCPNTKTCSGATETTRKKASVVCTADSCEPEAANEFGIPIDTRGNPDKLNWFFSVRVFDRTGARTIFQTLAQAKAYDAARLNENGLKNVNPADADPAPGNLADPEGPGWSYFFNHGAGASGSATTAIAGIDHNIWRTDERTASVSAVEFGCAFWNTLQPGIPVGAIDATTNCPINSPCKAGRAQISYLYGANAGTGGLCLKVNGIDARVQKNETLVPPHIGKLVAYVGEGQVSFGLTSVRVPQGGANVQLGEAQDLAAATQWLPVDRSAHRCRHSPKESQAGYAGPPSQAACRP